MQSPSWKDHRGYESDSSSSALQSPTPFGASREDVSIDYIDLYEKAKTNNACVSAYILKKTQSW